MRKVRIPTYHIKSIFDLSAENLVKKGYKAIFTDLDNTLDSYLTKDPSQIVNDKIKEFKDAGIDVIIISNNFKDRVTHYAKMAGLETRYFMMKPFSRKIKKLLKEKGYKNSEVIMIGDQIYTDVGAGIRSKLTTILVDPLTPYDQPFTRLKRKFERPLLKKMRKRNLLKEWEE